MNDGASPVRPPVRALTTALLLVACLSLTAQAQVRVTSQHGEVRIQNGPAVLRMMPVAGKSSGTTWMALDNVGNAYRISGYAENPTGGSDDPTEETVVVVDGYQNNPTGGSDDPTEETVVVADGYQDVLVYLREKHGVTVRHDPDLGADLLTLPGADDPLAALLEILTTDTFDGRPLTDYFRLLEVATMGLFDQPGPTPAKPTRWVLPFPNDRFYPMQWNLFRARLAAAQWHPARPKKRVRIAIIDSGIAPASRAHEGLDGAAVAHRPVAPSTGAPVAHALGIVSLLADRGQDASGIVGLLGQWDGTGCFGRTPLLADAPPEIISYNVGDFSPNSIYVAEAIRASVAQQVDVINLSLRLAYSPLVEEAIRDALAANVIVVAAAGNYAPGTAYRPTAFPANIEGVIAVGAAGPDMAVSPTSANEGLDLLAPGEEVLVGGPGDIWYYNGGTSLAAPHVTATVALMRAVRPDLTPAEALAALQRRAQAASETSPGFLNALSALNDVLPPPERVRYVQTPHTCSFSPGSLVDALGKDVEAYDHHIDDDLFPEADQPELPAAPMLAGNYPNPFNPSTTVRFMLPARQHVRLAVYNALGQEVQVLVEGVREAGEHEVRFTARNLPSGVYFARLEAAAHTAVRSLVLAE